MIISGARGAMAYALSLESLYFFKNHYGDIILNLTVSIVIMNVVYIYLYILKNIFDNKLL